MAFCDLALSAILVLFGTLPNPAYRAICIWCAVLLVLPPLGQVDISSFSKNLSQAASAATSPFHNGLCAVLSQSTVVTLAFCLFHIIRLFFFILSAWFFLLFWLFINHNKYHYVNAPAIKHTNQQNKQGDRGYY
jgi:hypothetical protein